MREEVLGRDLAQSITCDQPGKQTGAGQCVHTEEFP